MPVPVFFYVVVDTTQMYVHFVYFNFICTLLLKPNKVISWFHGQMIFSPIYYKHEGNIKKGTSNPFLVQEFASNSGLCSSKMTSVPNKDLKPAW